MDAQFLFVDGVQADKLSKKLMRRHVMKGKNVGKTLTRSSKFKLQTSSSSNTDDIAYPPSTSKSLKTAPFPLDPNHASDSVIRNFGHLAVSLPVNVEPYSHQIIHDFFALTVDRLYPTRFGFSLAEYKRMWLQIIFADEPSYYCGIALMQACNELLLNHDHNSSKALFHMSCTFTQVRKRLESEDALSDSTIALVISLIHQELIRKHQGAAKAHVKGLQRMIELRGGLDQLEGNLFLMLKVCKTDILFALQDGTPTIYFRDRMHEVRKIFASKGLTLNCHPEKSAARYHQLDLPLREIMMDITSVCSLLNEELQERSLDFLHFLEVLVSICYRLLKFRPLKSPERQCDIQSAYHIGSIIFMMTIFLQFDSRRVIDYELISLCFQKILESKLVQQENELALWITMVGGIWISGDAGSDWITPRILTAAHKLGLDTWVQVRQVVSNYPWVNAIHDEAGSKLWRKARDSD